MALADRRSFCAGRLCIGKQYKTITMQGILNDRTVLTWDINKSNDIFYEKNSIISLWLAENTDQESSHVAK